MSRDYAKTTSRKKKSGQLPGWVWMMGGLAIGLFVAFLVFLSNIRTPGGNTIATLATDTYSGMQENAKKHETNPAKQKPVKKDKTDKNPGTSTSFDFYYILPEIDTPVPERELKRKKQNPVHSGNPGNSANESDNEGYILQVGSFRELSQADQLKAKLVLNGMIATIQTVTVNNNTWHRVRIGPINDLGTLDRTRSRLKDYGIDSIVLKNKT